MTTCKGFKSRQDAEEFAADALDGVFLWLIVSADEYPDLYAECRAFNGIDDPFAVVFDCMPF